MEVCNMLKLSQLAAGAFKDDVPMNKSNTKVTVEKDKDIILTTLYLHGNPIATKITKDKTRLLFVNNQGWETPTTKRRLNAILDVLNYEFFIVQRYYDWYFYNPSNNRYIPLHFNTWVSIDLIEHLMSNDFNNGSGLKYGLYPVKNSFKEYSDFINNNTMNYMHFLSTYEGYPLATVKLELNALIYELHIK